MESNLLAKTSFIVDCVIEHAEPPPPHPPHTPTGNIVDLSYLEEHSFLHQMQEICTLATGALLSGSLLFTLPPKILKK